jgi:hypothetical protein
MVLAHQVGSDPFGFHELVLITLAVGWTGLMAVGLYTRRYYKVVRLFALRARRSIKRFKKVR